MNEERFKPGDTVRFKSLSDISYWLDHGKSSSGLDMEQIEMVAGDTYTVDITVNDYVVLKEDNVRWYYPEWMLEEYELPKIPVITDEEAASVCFPEVALQ